MLLEKIGYVVETVSISGRTTVVVHAAANYYPDLITHPLSSLIRKYRYLDDSILAVLKNIVCLFYS